MDDTTMMLDPRSFLKTISEQDFLNFGVQELAYIRPVLDQSGRRKYVICTADGHSLVSMDTHDSAMATILHNNLEAISLH